LEFADEVLAPKEEEKESMSTVIATRAMGAARSMAAGAGSFLGAATATLSSIKMKSKGYIQGIYTSGIYLKELFMKNKADILKFVTGVFNGTIKLTNQFINFVKEVNAAIPYRDSAELIYRIGRLLLTGAAVGGTFVISAGGALAFGVAATLWVATMGLG
jgi:hypothetical protein